ncbi:MAG: hypothetical protein R3Y46_02990 [Opitutales bacterium]
MQELSKDIVELWDKINKEAQEIIERELLIEDLVEDVVIKSENIFEAISKRLARKLGQNAIYEENLRSLFTKVFTKYDDMRTSIIEIILQIAKEDKLYNTPAKVLLYSRKFQISATEKMANFLLTKNKEDIALYIRGLVPLE